MYLLLMGLTNRKYKKKNNQVENKPFIFSTKSNDKMQKEIILTVHKSAGNNYRLALSTEQICILLNSF